MTARLALFGIALIRFCVTTICATDSRNSGFMLYHEIGDHGGMCLYARLLEGETTGQYKLLLSRSCLSSNTAWRWSWHPGGMLMSLYGRKCLGVLKLRNSQMVTLLPCEQNELQSWSCGANFNLEISEFRLEHQLIYDNWQIIGAHPILKHSTGTSDAKWIVYTENSTSEVVSVCDMPQLEFETDEGIITSPGGKQIGLPCIFPFVRKGKNVWKCIHVPELSENKICAVSFNLDDKPDDWGVCPAHKRGTLSEWIQPPLCDRACGGGLLILYRRCLYEPCVGQLSKTTQEECNTMSCSGDLVLAHGGSSYLFPVDHVFPVIGNTVFSKCSFPFFYHGSQIHECITSLERPQKWCSLTEDFDKHQKWGYCSSFFKGAWSTWSKFGELGSSCSKSCGSGMLTTRRRCRFSPCIGQHTLLGGSCNTKPCPECFDAKTRDYVGTSNTAVDGKPCKDWAGASKLPEEDPVKNPSLIHNYCRLPMKEKLLPYCYITPDNTRDQSPIVWMYCDIPPCGLDYSKPGMPYTVPAHPYDDLDKYPTAGGPCVFPFQASNYERYDRCISSRSVGREWCRTRKSTTALSDFAYCPNFFRGRWSEWKTTGECTKRCGKGNVISYRICLLPPCEGKSLRVDSVQCNVIPCAWSSPGLRNCFNGVGMSYAGDQTKTISGFQCQYWSAQTPVQHNLDPSIIPEDMPELRKNFCRNPTPGIRSAPWCYSSNQINQTAVRWEYCDVMKCPTKADVIYGIPLHISGITPVDVSPSPCIFPFFAPDRKTEYHACQRTQVGEIGTMGYCAVRNDTENPQKNILDGLKSGVYAICPSQTRGTTGSWTRSTCSKTCGGGLWIMKKKCYYPPCSVETKLSKIAPCNSQPCLDCFVGDGADYHGVYNTTYTGEECADWIDTPELVGGTNLEENYCRNPDARKSIPWCYTRRTLKEEYCDPKHCAAGIPYTIPQRGYAESGAKCAFPYRNGDDSYWTCQKFYGGYYCPVVDDITILTSQSFGMCPPLYKGSWSSWQNTGFCSKNCGSGHRVFVRMCLYPPCEGVRMKIGGDCNTHPCKWKSTIKPNIECYMNWGYGYIGRASKTFSGHTCMNWKSQKPHKHVYTHDFNGVPLVHNYCRNPTFDARHAPWCYTTIKGVRWEYCDIPRCQTQEGQIIAFLPTRKEKYCHFPFLLDGKEVHVCTTYFPDRRMKRYMCGATAKGVQFSDPDSWGYCSLAYRGTWSPWAVIRSDSCTVKCGEGRVRYKRSCRFHPCQGTTTKTMGKCNSQPCDECYDTEKRGTEYLGTKMSTYDDLPCNKRKIGIEYTAKCRNTDPDNFNSPWCIALDSQVGKVSCGLKHCVNESDPDGKVAGFDFKDRKSRFCDFPFTYAGKVRHSCTTRKHYKNLWCSFGLSYGGLQNMGQCFSAYKGTWSAWSGPNCSKPCGRGSNVYTRRCRYPPCQGSKTRNSGWCNTEPCDGAKNCYNVSDGGKSHVGKMNKSITGKDCSEWNADIRNKYPSLNFVTGKECRNPRGEMPRPWCYTNDGTYELCSIPHCPEPSSYPSVSDIFVDAYAHLNLEIKLPCIFPFNYNGKRYRTCTNVSPPKPGLPGDKNRKWCATVTNMDLGSGYRAPNIEDEFGYCKRSQIGTWMSWSGAEKVCTMDCYSVKKRYCLYGPCEGHLARVISDPCSLPGCARSWTSWTTWSSCQGCARISIQSRSQGDNLVYSRSKLCDVVPDVNERGVKSSCGMSNARHDVAEKAIVELLRGYEIRINYLSSARPEQETAVRTILITLTAVYFGIP